MEQPQEVEDEAYERVYERVAAIDVAKATGVVCTRVPGDGPSGRRQALANSKARVPKPCPVKVVISGQPMRALRAAVAA